MSDNTVQPTDLDAINERYAQSADSAVIIAQERIAEWDYDADPHGYCHVRPTYVALLAELAKVTAERDDAWRKVESMIQAHRAVGAELATAREVARSNKAVTEGYAAELEQANAERDELRQYGYEMAGKVTDLCRDLGNVQAERDAARVQAEQAQAERDHLRKVLDAANATTDAAQRIVTAALADGTATITPAAAPLDSGHCRSLLTGQPWGESWCVLEPGHDGLHAEAGRRWYDGQACSDEAHHGAAAPQATVPCDDATHTHCTDVHCGCGCHEGQRFDPFLRRWIAAAPQATCSCKWSPVQGRIWCDSCAAARDAVLAAAAAPQADEPQPKRLPACAECGHRHRWGGECAFHPWRDDCGYDAGADCGWSEPLPVAAPVGEPKPSPNREELIAVAKTRHDQVCNCDPKYVMSCPRMAQAILDGAKPLPVAAPDPGDDFMERHTWRKDGTCAVNGCHALEGDPGWAWHEDAFNAAPDPAACIAEDPDHAGMTCDEYDAALDATPDPAPHCGLCGSDTCPGKPGTGCMPGPFETYEAAGAGDGEQDATVRTCTWDGCAKPVGQFATILCEQHIAQRQADIWNGRHPVGTPVAYWRGVQRGPGVESVTRSPAWATPSGNALVSVEGTSGGISLTHVLPLDAPPAVAAPDLPAPDPDAGRFRPRSKGPETPIRLGDVT